MSELRRYSQKVLGNAALKFSTALTEEQIDESHISRDARYGNAKRFWFDPHNT